MKDYFYEINKEKIKKTIIFLKENLPKKSTKFNYQLTHRSLNAQYSITVGIEEKLQKIADLMREHLLIKEPIKIITIKNIDAGKFEMIGNLNCIYINSETFTQSFHQKVAILAHEMSHYYLMRKHRIIYTDEKENELLTEINAIYCGFGFLLLKGYKVNEVREGNKKYTSEVGYIGLRVIKDAIIETAYIRKQKPKWIIDNVDFIDKLHFYFRLRKLIKEYKKVTLKKR